MNPEELVAKAPISINLGPIPTSAILVLAAYGAGTAGTQAAVVVTSFMRKRKAKKTASETE